MKDSKLQNATINRKEDKVKDKDETNSDNFSLDKEKTKVYNKKNKFNLDEQGYVVVKECSQNMCPLLLKIQKTNVVNFGIIKNIFIQIAKIMIFKIIIIFISHDLIYWLI